MTVNEKILNVQTPDEGRVPAFLVETEWLARHLDDPGLLVFDCTANMVVDPIVQQRVHAERAAFEAGHIKGAQFIDIDLDLSDKWHRYHLMLPNAADFKRSIERLGVSNDSTVVIYSTGNIWWATRVWWMLRVYGFDHAHILNGSYKKWVAEGRPVETGPSQPRAQGNFVPTPPAPLVASLEDVKAALNDDQTCLINALRPAQFSGEEMPRKGRPGRIPRSISLPAANVLTADGRFLEGEALHEVLHNAGVKGGERVITYCGGGVSASAVAFVLMMSGHPDVRIYDASLAEWGSDLSLPMERDL